MGVFKGGLKSIKIELKACNVSVTGVNSAGLEGIQYTGSQSRTPQVSFKDGALVITEKPAAGGRKGLAVSNMSLDIKISKDADLRFLDIKLNSGDISVKDVSADWFSGIVGAGNITLTKSNFLKADLVTKAGNVNVSDTNLNKVKIDANAGSAKVDAVEPRDEYDIECNVKKGNVKIGNKSSSGKYKSKAGLYSWLGSQDFHKIPIMVSAFGDIFYYRKLENDENDVSLLDIHYRRIDVCTYSYEEFFEKYISDPEIKEKVLRKNLFDQAVEKLGSLKYNEAFFFVPALVLGGGEDIKYVSKGDAYTHQHLLLELGK